MFTTAASEHTRNLNSYFSSPVISPSLSSSSAGNLSVSRGSMPLMALPSASPLSRLDSADSSAASASRALDPRRRAAARASSSSSSSISASFRFFPGFSAVGQPAFAQPTRSAGLGVSHQIGPPRRPDSCEEHEMQPVLTVGPVAPALRKCNGTRQSDVVPKFEFLLSIAASPQRYSYPGFFHFAISAASPCFSSSRKS